MNFEADESARRTTLIIATGNAGKLAEFRDLLAGVPVLVVGLDELPTPIEIEESGGSYQANAGQKAQAVACRFGAWALGDDTGLEVDALQGAPGIFTARFAGPTASGHQNRTKLLEALQGVRTRKRAARFVCHLALADPTGVIRVRAFGQCQGRIVDGERGGLGFGYDGVFEVVEYHRTFGELGSAAKACLSHRARAVEQLRPRLTSLLLQDSAAPLELADAGAVSDV